MRNGSYEWSLPGGLSGAAAKKIHAVPASARGHTKVCLILIRPSSGNENCSSLPGWAAQIQPSQLQLVVLNSDHPLHRDALTIPRRVPNVYTYYYG